MNEKNKKFYWLKLQKDFFRRKEVKKMRSIAGGETLTIIYLELLLLSLETNGVIYFEKIGESLIEELAIEIDESPQNVNMTLTALFKMGLVETNSDMIYFLEIPLLTGVESASAERVRAFRERRKALQCNKNVTPEKEYRDKSIEIEYNFKHSSYNNNINPILSVPSPFEKSNEPHAETEIENDSINSLPQGSVEPKESSPIAPPPPFKPRGWNCSFSPEEALKAYREGIKNATGKNYRLEASKPHINAIWGIIQKITEDGATNSVEGLKRVADRSASHYLRMGESMSKKGMDASGVFANVGRIATHLSKFDEILNTAEFSNSKGGIPDGAKFDDDYLRDEMERLNIKG